MKSTWLVMILSLVLLTGNANAAKKTIGIIAFDGVLTSDITAPAEVFGAAISQNSLPGYDVKIIGVNKQKKIKTAEGLTINVNANIYDSLNLSVLIVPSSYEMEPLLANKKLIQFIQNQAKKVDWLASNCSGAYLLAESGLLDGKRATTWAGGEADLQKKYPSVKVQNNKKYVLDGNILTSNGSIVSYNAALKLLSLLRNDKDAKKIFDYLQMGQIVKSY